MMPQYSQNPAEFETSPSRSETLVGIGAAMLTVAMFGGLMMLFS